MYQSVHPPSPVNGERPGVLEAVEVGVQRAQGVSVVDRADERPDGVKGGGQIAKPTVRKGKAMRHGVGQSRKQRGAAVVDRVVKRPEGGSWVGYGKREGEKWVGAEDNDKHLSLSLIALKAS